MQFIMTFFWTFLLAEMVTYVVSSMNGAPFHFEIGLLLGVIVTVLIFVLTALIPNDPVDEH
ncbi:high-affinity Fe2+/Pb2+ permease [Bacillus ectoiniformans]|uniref:YjzD family protein n=1 Tax=Bacillus ectoiniformans TaxID=1494429 RepID=UPI00195BFF97|nr:YjzD family protein [Bacillus ectoiniformans]MBM7647556.1 high-affinity Fe2+/Pb2+ permease [Bacillus ectoiniformans]